MRRHAPVVHRALQVRLAPHQFEGLGARLLAHHPAADHPDRVDDQTFEARIERGVESGHGLKPVPARYGANQPASMGALRPAQVRLGFRQQDADAVAAQRTQVAASGVD